LQSVAVAAHWSIFRNKRRNSGNDWNNPVTENDNSRVSTL